MAAKTNIKGITIEIGGNTTGLDKALSGTEKQITSVSKELKEVEKALKVDPSNMEMLGQKSLLTAKQIETTTEKLKTLKEAQEQLGKLPGSDEREEQLRGLSREIVVVEGVLKNLDKKLISTDEIIGNSGQPLQELGENFEDTGEKASVFGDVLKANLTSDILISGLKKISEEVIALGKNVLDAGIGFESAFAGVEKTVDGTTQQLNDLKIGIRDMSKEIPATAENIAGVAEAAGQLGIKTESVLDFTRVMVDLGESTNMSADQAAIALAKFSNIVQMPSENIQNLGSTIVALGNNLATTEQDIVNMGLRLAGAGHQVGLTEAQILAFAGALSSVGIEAEMGGSAFSKVMIEIDMAAAEGEEALRDYAKVAGMTAGEFSEAWRDDAAGALASFIEGLGKIKEEGGNTAAVLADLGLKEVRVRDTMLRAAGAGELFRNSLELGSKAWEENNALTNEANKRYATTASQLQIAQNNLHDIGIEIGTNVLPAVKDLTVGFVDLVKDNKDNIAAFGTDVANALGFIIDNADIIVTGLAAMGVGFAGTAIEAGLLSVGITSLSGAFATLGTASLALAASPVGWIAAATAAVGLAITAWNRYTDAQEKAHQELLNTGDALKKLGVEIDNVTSATSNIENMVTQWENLKKSIDDTSKSYEERKKAEEDLAKIEQELLTSSNGIITNYDIENGLVADKIPLLKESLEIERELAKLKLEQKINDTDLKLLQETNAELEKNAEELRQRAEAQRQSVETLKGLEIEYQKVLADTTISEDARMEALRSIIERANEAGESVDYYSEHLGNFLGVSDRANEEFKKTIEELEKTVKEYQAGKISVEEYNLAVEKLAKMDLPEVFKKQSTAIADVKAITASLTEENKKTQQTQDDMSDAMLNTITEANKLEAAYTKLSKGQALTGSELNNLMKKFPDLAEYISQTNDVTFQGGEVIKEFVEQKKESTKSELLLEQQRLQAVVDAAKASLEATKKEFSGKASAAYEYYAAMRKADAALYETEQALKNVGKQIDDIDKINIKTAVSTKGVGKAQKETNEELEESIKILEHRKKIGELTTQQEIQGLEEVLKNIKMNAKERESIEEKLYTAKETLRKEELKEQEAFGDALVEALKRQKRAETNTAKEAVQKQIELISDMKYDEVEASKEVNSAKIKLLDEEYIAKVRGIDEGLAAFLSASNAEIQKRIDIIALTDKEAAAKLQGIQDEINGINELSESERKAAQEKANNEKRERLAEKLSKAQTEEDITQALKDIADLEAEISARGRDEERKAKLKGLEQQKKDIISNSKEIIEANKKAAEEIAKTQQPAVKTAVEELKTGEFGPEDKRESLKQLEQVYKDFEDTATKAAAELINSGKKGQDDTLKVLQQFYPEWQNKGKKFTDYLNQGIVDGGPNVINSASQLGRDALAAFNAAFANSNSGSDSASSASVSSFASPIMAQLEEFSNVMATGFSASLADTFDVIESAAKNLGLLDTVSASSTADIGQTINNIKFETTVNGVVPEDIGYKLERANKRSLRTLRFV